MNMHCVLATGIAILFALLAPVSQAIYNNGRTIPRLYSYYQDDGSCQERMGEATQRIVWNGRPWNIMAPESLMSPPSETKRNGTPLDIRPLNEFATQAQKQGAVVVGGDRDSAIAAHSPVLLRLVMVVHDRVADSPGNFSLQTIIAVRLCGAVDEASGSVVYIGPRKGVNLTEWWRSRKSQRWMDGYREAFALSVGDALEWAAGEANGIKSLR